MADFSYRTPYLCARCVIVYVLYLSDILGFLSHPARSGRSGTRTRDGTVRRSEKNQKSKKSVPPRAQGSEDDRQTFVV